MNRFSIASPTRPYAALPIVPLGSKVMADCRVTHYTSPCFFGGLTYVHSKVFSAPQQMMFPLLPVPERVFPIV